MAKNNKKSEVEKLKGEVNRLKKELKKRGKYGLVWEEKPEELVEMCKEKLPVLKEIKNKEIITDKEKPVNLLIEGDNYHALSVLNYTHAKKVDVIYIDPPYNTGNKDFIFNDHYIDKEDAYRHSKWLSFMEKRLKLAKNLLKDTGVIFISIDDNEVAQLKLLMDNPDLFRGENFISQIIWQTTQKNDPKLVAINHEYILCYAKNKNLHQNRWRIRKPAADLLQTEYKKLKNIYNIDLPRIQKELRKRIKEIPGLKPVAHYKYVDDKGVYFAADISDPQRSGPKHDFVIHPVTGKICKPPTGGYSPRVDEMKRRLINNEIHFGPTHEYVVCYKKYLTTATQNLNSVYYEDGRYASKLLGDIIGKNKFNNPKPIDLLKMLFSFTTNKNSVVLDFFAGSGTTGHVVLEMNKEDYGNRKFILCTNNENNNGDGFRIAEDICYPRIKKVIEGYKNLKGGKVEGLGGNLKYLRTAFVNAEPTDKNKTKLTVEATEMLCVKEGTFEKVLDQKNFKIFKNTNHYTGIIFDQAVIPSFKKVIKDIKGKFSVYIFSLGDETFDDEFKNVKQKVKLSPIPEAILRVYRRIFK